MANESSELDARYFNADDSNNKWPFHALLRAHRAGDQLQSLVWFLAAFEEGKQVCTLCVLLSDVFETFLCFKSLRLGIFM